MLVNRRVGQRLRKYPLKNPRILRGASLMVAATRIFPFPIKCAYGGPMPKWPR